MRDFQFPPFVPHPFLRNPHAQTIVAAYVKKDPVLAKTVSHRIELDDGDALILHDNCPAAWRAGDRTVLLLHGLGGSHRSPYMMRLAKKLNERGVRTFRLDLRGHGMGFRLAQHPGHAGRSEDAAAAAILIAELCPDSPLCVIGVSMGGNIVLKLLGEGGDIPPGNIDRAVAVAPPIDIEACSRYMLLPKNRLYTASFARSLIRQIKRRRRFVPRMRDLPLRPFPRTLWEFDDRFTAPLGGFDDATHYYAQASSGPLLLQIAVPTLILAACDDPVIPVEVFHRAQLSPTTRLILTDHGGHVGYLAHRSGDDPDRYWMDWRLVDWVVAPADSPSPRPIITRGLHQFRFPPRPDVESARRL